MHITTHAQRWLGIGLLGLMASFTHAQGPAATIDQLSWMTGNYAGAVGPNTLEETGLPPKRARSRRWCA